MQCGHSGAPGGNTSGHHPDNSTLRGSGERGQIAWISYYEYLLAFREYENGPNPEITASVIF